MKKIKLLLFSLFALFLSFAPSYASAGTASFVFKPTILNVAVGQEIDIESHLVLSSQDSDAFSVEINYPADMLSYKSHVEPANYKCGVAPPDTFAPGKLIIYRGCSGGSANFVRNEDFTVTTLKFVALKSGNATISYGKETVAFKAGGAVAANISSTSAVNVSTVNTGGSTNNNSNTNTNSSNTNNNATANNSNNNQPNTNNPTATNPGITSNNNNNQNNPSSKTDEESGDITIETTREILTRVLGDKRVLIGVGTFLAIILVIFFTMAIKSFIRRKQTESDHFAYKQNSNNKSNQYLSQNEINSTTQDSSSIDTVTSVNLGENKIESNVDSSSKTQLDVNQITTDHVNVNDTNNDISKG